MAKKYSSKCCTVIDNGLFLPFARKLSESFGQVNYWTPWQKQFPKTNDMRIGDGIEGIERIDFWEEVVDETDLFVVPDNNYGPLQVLLTDKLGKNVWGSRYGEMLELDRIKAKALYKKLGLPVNDSVDVKGVSKLREHLQKNDKQWIKISRTRGDGETFHSINYALSKRYIDKLEFELGASSEDKVFSVEPELPPAIESGIDIPSIDGQFTDECFTGIEKKDLFWIGRVSEYRKLPKALTEWPDAIAPTLKKNKYRNFLSTENRILKKTPHTSFMIDATCRVPSPPGGLWWKNVDNIDDMVWWGAQGKLVQPKFIKKYGCSIIMKSPDAEGQSLCVQYPDKIEDNVKLYNMAIVKGEKYILPQDCPMPEIGEVVGIGDSMEDAIAEAKDCCGQIEAMGLCCPKGGIEEVKEQLEELKEMGIDIT
jgi:hypothetical protein